MKDFCKWLGVNEKIAKIVVWLFIFMVMLIIFNSALESLGFNYYKITVDNLSRIDANKMFDYISSWILLILNFYTFIFLIFPIKEFKKIFKWSVLYWILNIVFLYLTNYVWLQIFIMLYTIVFSYLYSKKNWKYILYSIISIAINAVVQYISYLYKIRFIDYTIISRVGRFLLSIDYFIILGIMILIKEIYIKRKGVKN